MAARYLALPLAFEANQGQIRHPSQTAPTIDFVARGSGYTLFLTQGQAVLQLSASKPEQVLRLHFIGANAHPKGIGVSRLARRSHYLLGDDPTQWQTDIANYQAVSYTDIYDGIDLRYYGNQGRLEYDFILAAGVAPECIRMAFDGAAAMSIADNGDLVLALDPDQTVRFKAPLAYQDHTGERHIIASRYRIHQDGQVGFELAAYDTSRPLIIDPILDYTTYVGGSLGSDIANAITIDTAGQAYITGATNSTDFPGPPIQAGTGIDIFVVKLSADGTSAIYATYLGGNNSDTEPSIAIDATGRAYLTGSTQSTDFPTTTGAFDETHNDGIDAFVAVLNATGDTLQYGTYVGGQGANDSGRAIVVDSIGRIYIASSTDSSNSSRSLRMLTIPPWAVRLTHLSPSSIPVAMAPMTCCTPPTSAVPPAMKAPMISSWPNKAMSL